MRPPICLDNEMGSSLQVCVTFFVVMLSCVTVPPSTTVFAAEQIKLSIGGKMEQFFFVMDTDEVPGETLNTTGALSDVEVYFTGKTILDNGIEITARIELEAERSNAPDADEQWLDIKTAFGKFRFGETEGFNHDLGYHTLFVAYEDDEIVGRVVPNRIALPSVKEVLSFERFTGDAFTIGYESPALAGFTIGANYFPTTARGRDRFFDKSETDHNAWEVTGVWEGRISGTTLGLTAGYFSSQSRAGGNDGEDAWTVGGQMERGTVTVASTYMRSTPDNGLNSTAFNLSGTFEAGPLGTSASYLRVRAAATPNAAQSDTLNQGKLEASYILVRGVKLGLTGFWVEQRPAGSMALDSFGLISSANLRF